MSINGASSSTDTYGVTVSNSAGSATASTTLQINATPVNDTFANARLLTGSATIARGTNASATKEGTEPNHGGNASGNSVWWKWTAPQAGQFTVDTVGSNFNSIVAVYTGTSVSALTPVSLLASSDVANGAVLNRSVSFMAVAGTNYYFAVDGNAGSAGPTTGAIDLQVTNQSDYLPAYPVSTLAGTASVLGTTDGTGTAAKFHNPAAIAMDSTGNFYVADQLNHTIRKITSTGVVTTLAGTAGSTGSADGTGTAAKFNNPSGVAVDANGIVYVADTGNHTIRAVSASGVVTTLAGSAGFAGFTDGLGTAARFNGPAGIAVDPAGYVIVADSANHTIRTISPGGSVVTTAGFALVPGNTDATGTAARFNNPTGVAVDSAYNIYVADNNNHTVRRLAPTGVVTTLAGNPGISGSSDGVGTNAGFKNPAGVAVDGAGNIFVADYGNHTIRFITTAGKVTTVAGAAGSLGSTNAAGTAARFNNPRGLVVDSAGNFYVADDSNHLIRKTALTPSAPVVVSPTQPASVTGTLGGTVTIYSTGTSLPSAALQWYHGTPGSGVKVDSTSNPSALTATLTLTNLALADAGTYYLVATSSSGNATTAVVTVNLVAKITTQPVNQTVLPKATATFSVSAVGAPAPTYQWQRQALGVGSWSNLSDNATYGGSATATLTVSNTTLAMSRDQFQCVLTNVTGPVTSNPATLSLAANDMNGDGWPDLAWESTANNSLGLAGDRAFWLTTPTTVNDSSFLDTPYLANIPTAWRIAGRADFNGDGQTDILWENTVTGDHTIWFMNGVKWTGTQAYAGWADPSIWRVAAVADFNADGKPDILWEDVTDGYESIWFMNGTLLTGFSDIIYTAPGVHVEAAADFNGDGYADLLALRPDGSRIIYFWNGTSAFNSLYFLGPIALEWHVVEAADFNGDGQADLVWEDSIYGYRFVWLLEPNFGAPGNFNYPDYGVFPGGKRHIIDFDPAWHIAP